MDHYTEQLVRKYPDGKDKFIRGIIIVCTILVSLFCVYATIIFLMLPLLLIMVAALYLGYYLATDTITEYEYIITNNDMDIDKIKGRRKRKRLISVNLRSVEAIGEYTGTEGKDVSATVIATDNSGEGAWYLIAKHDSYGKVMVLFTPENKTLFTMNQALTHSVKLKIENPENDGPDEENAESPEDAE